MQIILILLNIICTLFGVYFAVTCLCGAFRKKNAAETAPSSHRRIAAVIAARNESAVIGPLVESLMRQNYPKDKFDVYVVPNNCTDNTEEIALAAGAHILYCDEPVSSKGDALRCAFRQLTQMENGYDAYCIFDADNLVDAGFFQAVNKCRAQGYLVAQGYRDSKNPYASWVSGSMSVFYWFMSRFYNTSRAGLNMSCALNGTGFMVSDQLIRKIGWETCTLTEDLEFSAICALNDVKIGWMPDARVFDEQPDTLRVSFTQRRRWSAGSLQCFFRYAKQLFAHRTLHAFDMGILFTGMLLNVVGLFSGILTVCTLADYLRKTPDAILPTLLASVFALIGCYLLFALACTAMFALEKRLCKRALPAILTFALFMLTWMPINLLCFVTRPPRWNAIRHTGNVSIS